MGLPFAELNTRLELKNMGYCKIPAVKVFLNVALIYFTNKCIIFVRHHINVFGKIYHQCIFCLRIKVYLVFL